jgi:hypothetical protein
MFKRSWFRNCRVWSYRAADSGGPRGDGRRSRADASSGADGLPDRGASEFVRLRSLWFLIGCVFMCLCSRAWAAALPLGQTQTGTISSAAQSNSYTFSANAGAGVHFTLVATSGKLNPNDSSKERQHLLLERT